MFEKIFGRRTKGVGPSAEKYDVVLDLDQILATPKAFTFQGEDFIIRAIEVEEFMKVTQALAHLDALKAEKSITNEQLVDAYTELFGSVCSKFKRRHIESMTLSQVGALFNFVLKCISGEAFKELTPQEQDEKKKMLMAISRVKESELSTGSASAQPT